MFNDKWNKRFLNLANTVASWSKDPSTKVGAVIVRPDKTIASLGFNGFPRKIYDDPLKLEDRPTKYRYTIHAELNAILSAGVPSLNGCALVCTHPPCLACAASIIQAGIVHVIYPTPTKDMLQRWGESMAEAAAIFREAGVAMEEVNV